MKKPYKVFIEEDEFDFNKSVTITDAYKDPANVCEHSIIAYIDENNNLCMKVSHDDYEYDCDCYCGEMKQLSTSISVPLDELM